MRSRRYLGCGTVRRAVSPYFGCKAGDERLRIAKMALHAVHYGVRAELQFGMRRIAAFASEGLNDVRQSAGSRPKAYQAAGQFREIARVFSQNGREFVYRGQDLLACDDMSGTCFLGIRKRLPQELQVVAESGIEILAHRSSLEIAESVHQRKKMSR